jgi:hypothetical protein
MAVNSPLLVFVILIMRYAYLCFSVPGGDMGTEMHGIRSEDAPSIHGPVDVEGMVPSTSIVIMYMCAVI